MKRTTAILALFCLAVTARADLFITQEVKSTLMNGEVVIKIKGDKVRLDVALGPAGAMSMIRDTATGDLTTLIHAQKMAMKVSGAQMPKLQASAAKLPIPQPTGRTEKVGAYNAEIYTCSVNGATQTFWVAKDFPNYAKLKTLMKKLKDSPVIGPANGMSPDLDALPGMVVKIEANVAGQKATTTLVSVKEMNFDAAVFEAPADYQTLAQPGPPPGPPGTVPK